MFKQTITSLFHILDAHFARDIGSPDVLVVELIAALRAEFGRMLGVFRLPAALVTAVLR